MALPVPITSPPQTRRIPMPVFYGNPALSFYAVMLFPDDLDLARKLTAKLLNYGTTQIQDLPAILADLRDGQPEQRLFRKRRYWARAAGQIVKALFALTNDNDPRVRERASWEQAIRQAEREIGRTIRGNRSSLHVQLRRFQPVLHFCGAFEMAGEGPLQPPTIEAMMINAMGLYDMLRAWHVKRSFPGSRNDYLAGDIFWRWEGSTYDDNHGIPAIGISFENLVPHGKSGRPRKPR
jgi:hypothetical protein